jgi:hypothetical protein
MLDERWAPAGCLLADGKHALIVGGYSYTKGVCVDSADVYDEKRHKFIHCHGHLKCPRDFATSTLLPDGNVLVAGGYHTELGSLATAELYVSRHNRFEPLKSTMSNARELFTSTRLRDGRVLCVAGLDLHKRGTVNSADLFDPETRTFQPVVSHLSQDRFGQAAVLLADGRVLIVGGKSWKVGHQDKPLTSAEIFDPATGLFHRTVGDMSVARDRPTATLLPNGKVLVAGGQNGAEGPLECELFDPATETFSPAGKMHTSRMAHGAIFIPPLSPPVSGGVPRNEAGWVMLAGGWCPPSHSTTSTVELFDTATGTCSEAPPLPVDTHDFAVVRFPDGLLLIAGGKQVDKKEKSLDGGWVMSP